MFKDFVKMYHVLGIPSLIRNILYINAFLLAVLATSFLGGIPNIPIFRAVPLSVLLTTGLLFSLGQTALFPLICRLPFVWRVFPDLDGKYAVELASNWPLIQAREAGQAAQMAAGAIGNLLLRKNGTLTITARLFTIDVHLDTDDRYSSSDTVICNVTRESGQARATLNYLYRARVLQPQTTDSSQHFGAARIEIPKRPRPDILEGAYWTDRNWHQARNTAGTITLRRRKRSRKNA